MEQFLEEEKILTSHRGLFGAVEFEKKTFFLALEEIGAASIKFMLFWPTVCV